MSEDDHPFADPVSEAAAHWAVLIGDRDLTDDEQKEFDSWVINPRHEEEFLAHLDLAFGLRDLSPELKRRLMTRMT